MDDDKYDDERTISLSEMTPRQQRVTLAFVAHLVEEIRAIFQQHQIVADVSVGVVNEVFDFTVVCKAEVYDRAYELATAVYDNVMRKVAEGPTH